MNVVGQHRGEKLLPELAYQLLSLHRADRWYATHGLENHGTPTAAFRLAWTHQRPQPLAAVTTVLPALIELDLLDGPIVALVIRELGETARTLRDCQAFYLFRKTDGFPVEAHTHTNPAEDEKLLSSIISAAQLLAQLQQLGESIGAVQNPDTGIRDGFKDLPTPFVDQVRRRDD